LEKPSTGSWSDKQAGQSASSDWRQLSNEVQMKVEMCCTVCGGVGHVAANCMAAGAATTVTAGAADKPETTAEVATSIGGPPGAPPTEGATDVAQAGAMSSPSSCPKGNVVTDAATKESCARYRANRYAKQKGDNKGKAAGHVKGRVSKGIRPWLQGKPTDFPERWMRGQPEYDAYRGIDTSAGTAKGKSKKGKSKKGKS